MPAKLTLIRPPVYFFIPISFFFMSLQMPLWQPLSFHILTNARGYTLCPLMV